MKESEIEKILREKIKEKGGRAYKFISPGNGGVPDRLITINGKVIFVELKRPGGQLTNLQKKQIRDLTNFGMEVYVIQNLDEINEFMERIEKICKS